MTCAMQTTYILSCSNLKPSPSGLFIQSNRCKYKMKSYPNIEKSAFRKGEYVGYSEGKVYHISKTNSSFGTWFAHNRDNYNEQIFAFGLAQMSERLAKVTQ